MSARGDRPLALTLGEPAGIGPDLALAIWCRRVELGLPPFYLIGDPDFLMRRAQLLGLDVPLAVVAPQDTGPAFDRALPVVPVGISITAAPGKPDASSAPAAIAAIRRAVDDVLGGRAAAMVTNPVAKNVLYRSGFAEPGHTEFLARLAAEATGKPLHPVMMLWSPELAVVPVTIHLPLREVPAADHHRPDRRDRPHRRARSRRALRHRAARGWRSPGSIRTPARTARWASEDAAIVAPAVERLAADGIDARGPLPADTLFHERGARDATTRRSACITTRR